MEVRRENFLILNSQFAIRNYLPMLYAFPNPQSLNSHILLSQAELAPTGVVTKSAVLSSSCPTPCALCLAPSINLKSKISSLNIQVRLLPPSEPQRFFRVTHVPLLRALAPWYQGYPGRRRPVEERGLRPLNPRSLRRVWKG